MFPFASSKHSLEHGHQEVPNAWVLLDKEEAIAVAPSENPHAARIVSLC